MSILIAIPDRIAGELAENIRELAPDLEVSVWPDVENADAVDFAVLWKQPAGLFTRLPNLQAVTSMGAGVDAILADPDLPDRLPVGRLAGPRLAANMAAYLAAMVINRWKRLPRFAEHQRRREWRQWAPEDPPRIGLLGAGAMGRKAAEVFLALDFPVAGWSRSGTGPDGVTMHCGQNGLERLASESDYLVCLLPLTPETRGILDAGLMALMPAGSCLVNVGRGEHLDEVALLDALDRGRPGHAILDVFATEPLPDDHPFWTHPAVTLTPHCSSVTLTREAAELALDSYRRVQAGKPPLGEVDRDRGY